MQSYEGYFENGKFYIKDKIANINGRKRAIITILDEPVNDNLSNKNKSIKKPLSESRGIFKNKIKIADDFDQSLEEFEDYMI